MSTMSSHALSRLIECVDDVDVGQRIHLGRRGIRALLPRQKGRPYNGCVRNDAPRIAAITGRVLITTIRVVVLTILAAVVVFCGVQDRVTAAGARRYVA